MGERETAKEIMKERLADGIEILKSIAKEEGFEFNENLFIKGIECGISLYIQKERIRK